MKTYNQVNLAIFTRRDFFFQITSRKEMKNELLTRGTPEKLRALVITASNRFDLTFPTRNLMLSITIKHFLP